MTDLSSSAHTSDPQDSNLQNLRSIPVEVLDDAAYADQLEALEQLKQHDQQARERARKLLRRYSEGFTPNLIQQRGLLPYDGILATKAILQLLSLSLAEDQHCPKGAKTRSPFSQPTAYNTARSCGKRLNFVGGYPLMQHVLQFWIPAFDQSDLSETWIGIGEWSG